MNEREIESMDIYANDAQMYALLMMARDEVLVCGRGTGKGFIQAMRMLYMIQHMPGCTLGFVGPSYKKTLMTTLPSMLIHLERIGFKRDLHYCVNHRPPKALHWKDPFFMPESWEHTISFYNGSVVQLITQDREGASNGLSLDGLIIDEAKFIDYEKLKNETFQTNRGSEMYFGKCPVHHGMTITCDMPTSKRGSWFLKYADDAAGATNSRVVEVLESLVYQRERYMQRYPNRTADTDKFLRYCEANISYFRKRCLLYKEYPSTTNLAVLGEDFIRRMKRELPALTFDTSIMCKRRTINQDSFYNGIVESVNYYDSPNRPFLDAFDYNVPGDVIEDCRMDGDLDDDLPLIITLDINNNINWLVVGQVDRRGLLRVLKSFYVKYERKVPELLDDFMAYYKYKKRKAVTFYYDNTFKGHNYSLHYPDPWAFIKSYLQSHGWRVTDKYIGQAMAHWEKNQLINRMFRGRATHQVLINKTNNVDLIICLECAESIDNKKNKSGEKLIETEQDQLQHRTDGSDAFDTLCIGVEKYPVFSAEGAGLVTTV